MLEIKICNVLHFTQKLCRLQQTTCSTGIWSRDYLPESEIKPHSTTIYRVESQGFLTGVTDCIAHYGTMDGMTSFRVGINNFNIRAFKDVVNF